MAGSNKIDITGLLKKVQLYLQKGQLQQAEQLCRQVLAADPHNVEAHHYLGVIACRVGKHDIGSQHLTRAIQLQPGYAKAYNELGSLLHAQGCLDDAIKHFQQAIAVKPDYAEAYNNLANALKDSGELEAAIESYQKAIQLKPDIAVIHNNLGKAFKEKGELDKALDSINKAIALWPDFAEAHNERGDVLKTQGRFDEAAASYQKALSVNPKLAAAHNNLAGTYRAQGRFEEAIASYQQALALVPQHIDILRNLGHTYRGMGNLDEAVARFQEIIEINPQYAEGHNDLGNLLKEQGKEDETIDCYVKAINLKPDYALAYNNLATVLCKKGRRDEAIAGFQKAVALEPDFAEAHNNLGNLLAETGRLEQAVISFQNAISIQPQLLEPHNNLGNVFKDLGRLPEAINSYQNALEIDPDSGATHCNLGNVLARQGKLEEAVISINKALSLDPDNANFHNNLGTIQKDQGMLAEAIASFRQAILLKENYHGAHSNLLLVLNYMHNITQEDIFKESLRFGQEHADGLQDKGHEYENSCQKERRLRIGYVSPDFRMHSVSYFFEPVLLSHNRQTIEVFCYANLVKSDFVSKRLQKAADQWRSIVGLTDTEVAEQIRQDRIDILVDLAGHTARNNLLAFARKPAPIQVSWLGYPNTSGMQAMDYRLTDAVADPVGEADRFHTEKLVRLQEGFLCYQGDESLQVKQSLPCVEKGYVTFGSFNNLAKTTPEVVEVWAKILTAVPDSHLLLKCRSLGDEKMQQRYLELFAKHEISADRVKLYGWLPTQKSHLDLYSMIDIGLDPFPYNGTTTTCEALWMGVPVVTLRGDRHAGRVGAAIMHAVGLEELVADSVENYIQLAETLASDRELLAEMRKGLRMEIRQSKLMDSQAFTHSLEDAYRQMWHRWCDEKQ